MPESTGHALVLSVDEKSQCQALERTQPVLPMGLGYVEGITHDYIRHGTTTLFAALDVANGTVLAQCKPKHRHQEFLAFLRHIEANVPEHLDVHLICDNYGTHKHARVKAWLARRPRFHLHFTPTYSSWLNQVERWFALITNQAIRRGSFDSVADLKRKIDTFVKHYNQHPTPFRWTATAESILGKLERLCKVINGTQHKQLSLGLTPNSAISVPDRYVRLSARRDPGCDGLIRIFPLCVGPKRPARGPPP